MLKIIIGILILLLIFFKLLIYLIYLIRYFDFKEIFFWILGKKYSIKNIVYFKELNLKNINTINKVLGLKLKGNFIETLIATPAWEPIISLESVDNDKWIEVKKNFLFFIKEFGIDNKINNISDYINQFTEEYIEQKQVINSEFISKITVKSFCKLLFDITINLPDLEILYQASLEWRKEIAIKGKGNLDIKNTAIQIILNYIKLNKKIYSIFNENWNKPEFYSVVLQPFIISPMINISDIMVSMQILLNQKLISSSDIITNDFVNRIIFSFHPFPVLERFDPDTNTQYFIPLDQLAKWSNYMDNYKNLVFGSGPRRCSGQLYAYIILKKFFQLYLKNQNNFNPIQSHKYSGRSNDNLNLNESLYMGKILFKLLLA